MIQGFRLRSRNYISDHVQLLSVVRVICGIDWHHVEGSEKYSTRAERTLTSMKSGVPNVTIWKGGTGLVNAQRSCVPVRLGIHSLCPVFCMAFCQLCVAWQSLMYFSIFRHRLPFVPNSRAKMKLAVNSIMQSAAVTSFPNKNFPLLFQVSTDRGPVYSIDNGGGNDSL